MKLKEAKKVLETPDFVLRVEHNFGNSVTFAMAAEIKKGPGGYFIHLTLPQYRDRRSKETIPVASITDLRWIPANLAVFLLQNAYQFSQLLTN